MTTGALERVVRRSARRGPAAERCDLCAREIGDRHRHVLDESREELLCACQACALLFEREAAGRDHYRLVPQRRVRLSDVPAKELGVPVGLAFFIAKPDGRVIAHYPSPAGATQWDVDAQSWARVAESCPALRGMLPGVEALLVNFARGADEQWLVPVDDCHRLVAVVRREWKGLSGGSAVWPRIEEFFADLASSGRRRERGRDG
jgi:hypothetical protein